MYSVVLMTALTTGGNVADCHWHNRSWCHGCTGCASYVSCSGCYYGGGYGSSCAYGSCGCYGAYSCLGCYSSGGYGCYSSYGNFSNAYGGWGTPYGCHGCYNSSFNWGCMGCGCWGTSPYHPMVVPSAPVNPPTNPPPGGEKKPADGNKSNTSNDTVRAKLIVELPEDAQLYVDNVKMNSSSGRRVFLTPPLQAGQAYYYDLRAVMQRDGQPVNVNGRVIIRPGQEVTATLSNPNSDGTFLVSTENR